MTWSVIAQLMSPHGVDYAYRDMEQIHNKMREFMRAWPSYEGISVQCFNQADEDWHRRVFDVEYPRMNGRVTFSRYF